MYNDHTFPDRGSSYTLQSKGNTLACLGRSNRSPVNVDPKHCKKWRKRRRRCTYRFRCMVLIMVLSNLPFESGPKIIASPAFSRPALMIPSTTVPT